MSFFAPRRGRALLIGSMMASLGLQAVAASPRQEEDRAFSSLEQCDALVGRHPSDHLSWLCYRKVAVRTGRWDDAARRLRAHLAIDREHPGALLGLGAVESSRAPRLASELLERAADGFAALGQRHAQARALLLLAYQLGQQGRHEEAGARIEQAGAIVPERQDPILQARLDYHRGLHAFNLGDYGQAWGLYKKAEQAVFPDGPEELRAFVLGGLGTVAGTMGRVDESLELFEKQADLLHRTGDLHQEAASRYNIAFLVARPTGGSRVPWERGRGMFEEVLSLAARGGNREIEGLAHLRLSQDPDLPWPGRIGHLERSLALGREAGSARGIGQALRLLAQYRIWAHPEDHQTPVRLDREAVDLARSTGDSEELARALNALAEILRQTGPHDAAVDASHEALDAIERVRDLQRDDRVKARLASQWAFAYQRYVGYLLEPAQGPPGELEVDLAFQALERLRARVLLEMMDAARATEAVARPGPLPARRRDLLDRISAVQKRLIDPALDPADRARKLSELEGLEEEETALREEMSREDHRFASLRSPGIPGLDDLRGELADDEALLAFQLANRKLSRTRNFSGGGSWLLVITSTAARAIPLPDRDELEPSVQAFLGLLERRDGEEARGAAALHRDLLAEAIAGLPSGTSRLVIAPDGVLHRLPFGALRAAPSAPPLAQRYEMELIPSASIWMRLRRQEPAGRETSSPALALADPDLAVGGPNAEPSTLRSATFAEGLKLGPLPLARREARAFVRNLGRGSRLMEGPDAAESTLKQADLRAFGVLHFAAHAVSDDTRPERSAILLAPGGPTEDGLLQIREIVDLELSGRLVVLSACSSASGPLLASEGVMGLARAFFQAGARAVVGSLLPLRDDEAASIMADLSRHLGRGMSVRSALSRAQRDRAEAGAPAASWAGLVVLGDGGAVPVPGGRSPVIAPSAAAAAAAALLTAVIVFLGMRKRRAPRA